MRFSSTRLALIFVLGVLCCGPAVAQRQMDALNRGLVAIRKSSTQVYLSWRLFGNEPPNVAFNLYRAANGGPASKLNTNPITATTDYTDSPGVTNLTNNAYSYFVRPVINGIEQANSETAALPASPPQKQFLTLPLRADTGPNGPYTVKFCWVGDLDGDGDYDFVVDRLSTLGAYEQFLEAYTNDGTFLWRMAMGPNSVNQYSIEPGSSAISVGHGDNVTVYDMDGDGKAEVLIRTSNGVVFGNGSVVAGGASDNVQFLSVVNGLTGAELARATVPNPRLADGPMNGHMGILYLDGKRPSVLLAAKNRDASEDFHGTITAWDWRGGVLSQRWTWEDSGALHSPEGHQIRIGDVDNDGKDEFVDIGYVLDDSGTQLFNIPEIVHGDRFHLTDIDPDRPGLENFIIQQNNPTMLATELYDAGTGDLIRKWYSGGIVDVGRGIALDINPTHKGYEMFSTQPGIFNAKGQQIYANNVWAPEGLWWDGDLGREFIDGAGNGALNPVINKFNAVTGVTDRVWSLYSDWGDYSIQQAYGGRPTFWGDILGDWREELIFVQSDYAALRIYTTTNAASNKLYTLMHNPQYRCQATTKGYVQASYVDYYLGFGMSSVVPPPPMIATDLTWSSGTTWNVGTAASWKNAGGASSVFAAGNRVLFDVSGSNATAVALSGILNPGAVNFFNPQDFTLDGTSGSLSGTMTLAKSGKGRVTLTGSHAYTGTTTIWDGALVVNGQISNSPVTVWGGTWGGALAMGQTGGRLAGTGTISQPVTLEYRGAITPGSGMGNAGTLTLGSGLTVNDGAALAYDLSNDPSGVSLPSDRIHVSGNLVLSGVVHIVVTALNGLLAPGTYTLLTYAGSLSGSASNIALTLPEGTAHTLNVGAGAITLIVPVTRAPAALVWKGGSGGNAWDIANTANWFRSGTADTFVAGDSVTFDSTGAASPTVNLTNSLPVGGVLVSSNTDYQFTGTGSLTGSGGLTKTGTGNLTVLTTNNYSGPTLVTGGTLAVGNLGDGGAPSSIGSAGTAASNLTLNGATLALVGEQTSTNRALTLGASGGTIAVSTSLQISGQITGAGSLTKSGAGNLILAASNNHSGGTIVSAGKLVLASDAANVSGLGGGGLTLSGGTLTMTDNVDTTSWATSSWSIHVPAGTAGRLNADGRCNLTGALTGGGDFTFYTPYVRTELLGNWSAFTGRIFVITDSDGGDFRFQHAAGYPAALLDLGANVYAYYNKAMTSNITLPVGNLSGVATSVLRGGPTSGRTMFYQVGARNEDGVFAGRLMDSTGSVALEKVGGGTLTLSGASTHTGATTVTAGRLRVTGSTAGTNYTVKSGATLGGTGSITGNLTVQSGGGLEWSGAPLAITGNVTFSGDTVIRAAAGLSLTTGSHTLLTYTGTLTGSPVFIWEASAGVPYIATFNTSVPNVITMTLEELPRVPGPIIWSGANGFDWDGANNNWLADAQAVSYMNGDTPTFTDSGNAASAINLTTTVTPTAVVVDSTKNHTISGSGGITGSASLSKSGSGTLTISSAHSFEGGTAIHAGTVAISNAAALGTGTVTLNGGTWATGTQSPQNAIHVTADSTLSGGQSSGQHAVKNITGSGTLTLNTTSVFDLEGDLSEFSGTFALTGSGSLRFYNVTNNASALATFDLGTRGLSARSGSAFNLGALSGQAGSYLGMSSSSNSSNCTYTIGGNNAATTFAGVIANGSPSKPVHIVKTGSGHLMLAGTNTYTGVTTINSGKLSVTGSLDATTTTVATTGTLGGNGSIAGAVTCHGTLAPGNSTGTLSLSSGLTLSSTSTLDCELGTTSDLVAVTGGLTLDGTVNVTAAPGFAAGTYTLITYSGSLTNNTVNVGSLPPGFIATVNTATNGQVRLIVTAAPAPATITLGNLIQTYDGSEKSVTVATVPGALSHSVTYNDSATKPTQVGTYAVVATITDPNYQGTASTSLVIEPGGITWASWRDVYFSEAEQTAGLAAENADPDFDSLTNLGEYALGTPPHQFTAPFIPVLDANGLSLTFIRPAGLLDVTYSAESTVNFGIWSPVPLEVLNPGSDPETVRARDPLTSGDPNKRFIRLRFRK